MGFVINKKNNYRGGKKFVLCFEISYSKFDNNFLLKSFLWSGWQNWERDKGEMNQEPSPLWSPDMPECKSYQQYSKYCRSMQHDIIFLMRLLSHCEFWLNKHLSITFPLFLIFSISNSMIFYWKLIFLKQSFGEAVKTASEMVIIAVGIYPLSVTLFWCLYCWLWTDSHLPVVFLLLILSR